MQFLEPCRNNTAYGHKDSAGCYPFPEQLLPLREYLVETHVAGYNAIEIENFTWCRFNRSFVHAKMDLEEWG